MLYKLKWDAQINVHPTSTCKALPFLKAQLIQNRFQYPEDLHLLKFFVLPQLMLHSKILEIF